LASLFCLTVHASDQTSLEYQVKAAYLYNFAKFVTWPQGADNSGPLVICVMGKDPFGPALDDAVRGKSLHGQVVTTKRLPKGAPPQGCQIVFVTCSESACKESLSHSDWEGILVVGEGDAFVRDGGMIGLILKDGRVQFTVNIDALTKARLDVSSKLLQLAAVVEPGKRK
jgi:hypothetical protein